MRNKIESNYCATYLNIPPDQEYAIPDTSYTAYFLLTQNIVKNKRIAMYPISVSTPDIRIITSTHTFYLKLPQTPKNNAVNTSGTISMHMPSYPYTKSVIFL